MCSEHFNDQDIEYHAFSKRSRLNPEAIPSIFNCWKDLSQINKRKDNIERPPNKLITARNTSSSSASSHLPQFKLPVSSTSISIDNNISEQLPLQSQETTLTSSCETCSTSQAQIRDLTARCTKLMETCQSLNLANKQLKTAMQQQSSNIQAKM